MYFCDIHHNFSMGPKCCRDFFDDTPVFNHAGVCYTVKTEIREHIASSYSNIRYYFIVDNDKAFSKSEFIICPEENYSRFLQISVWH